MDLYHIYIYLATCGDPTPVNGEVSANNLPIIIGYYYVGTTVSFTCDSGYDLFGGNSSSCHVNGSWNPVPPVCNQGNQSYKCRLLNMRVSYFLSVIKLILFNCRQSIQSAYHH